MQAALKAVVASAEDKRAQKLISDILSSPGGVEELYRQAPLSNKAPTAYAFLAMACKDHSALSTAATLLREVVRIERNGRMSGPSVHNHVLNLAHVLETNGEFAGALQVMCEHMQLVVDGSVPLNGAISAREYGHILSALTTDVSFFSTIGNSARSERKSTSIWFPPKLDSSLRVVWHPSESNSPGSNEGFATVVPCSSTETIAEEGSGEIGPVVDMTNDLDLLAITFTIVKILFVQGNLALVPHLVRAIEPIRRRAKVPIHSTNVRNEHAYYMCICQVMWTLQNQHSPLSFSPFNSSQEATKPLYVVGDSHCLSCAWSLLNVAGEMRVLVPKLVTGVKQWHLRQKSDFYTKESFQKTIASIPEGSEVCTCKFN